MRAAGATWGPGAAVLPTDELCPEAKEGSDLRRQASEGRLRTVPPPLEK